MRLSLSSLSLSLLADYAASAPPAPSSPTTTIELAFVPTLTGDRRYHWDRRNSVWVSGRRPRCDGVDGLMDIMQNVNLEICVLCESVTCVTCAPVLRARACYHKTLLLVNSCRICIGHLPRETITVCWWLCSSNSRSPTLSMIQHEFGFSRTCLIYT